MILSIKTCLTPSGLNNTVRFSKVSDKPGIKLYKHLRRSLEKLSDWMRFPVQNVSGFKVYYSIY